MTPRVRLAPMSEAEFDDDERVEAAAYAEENVRAGYWAAGEARALAARAHAQILPQGAATPGHHFLHIEDAKTSGRVGALWWWEDRTGSAARAFVYHPSSTRRGDLGDTARRP